LELELRRGEIWTVSGGPEYTGKPRPVVIIQNDQFSETRSVTVCGLTTTETDTPFARLLIEPSPLNGLRSPSHLMVDKITTVSKLKIGYRVGRLDDGDLPRLNWHLKVFLGLSD
jgi:mRNA interferase MazF